ncbi:MAG: class F sortase [Candidatus Falkowbacteria bacterium]|nr:class F sortase [Candidatus Falkowbacteria bacterium]
MRLKILSRRTLVKVSLIGITLSLAFLFYFLPISSIQSSPAPLLKNIAVLPPTAVFPIQEQANLGQEQINFGLPVRLTIPKIKVEAAVESVGLTPQGAMGVPKKIANVAWFSLGSRPGEIGSAVMAGHYGYKNGSAFDDLNKLRPGDKLYSQDDKGTIVTFTVREIKKYNPKDDASDVFGSSDGKSHLNLVTCAGIWSRISKSYSKRLVIFTDKE